MGRLKASIRHALQVGERIAFYPVDVTDYHGIGLGVYANEEDAVKAIRENDDLEGNDTVAILYRFDSGLVYESSLFMGGKRMRRGWSEIGFYNGKFEYKGFIANKLTEPAISMLEKERT